MGYVAGVDPRQEPALYALAAIVGVSVAPLFLAAAQGTAGHRAVVILTVFAAIGAYFSWHHLVGWLMPMPAGSDPSVLHLAVVLGCFVALFFTQAVLSSRPEGALARALHPVLFAGFYLDEVMTRLTFRVWPPRLPDQERRRLSPLLNNMEA